MNELIVTTPLDLDNLADDMASQLTNDEILDFIVNLDLTIADWQFTEALYKWAKGEHKTYKAEKKEYGF